ncbi:hypothetical protein Godav_005395 [Gossypium davidsonii]|uniref:RNase H type-1 domain-containing protein n=1 Tax=Gossypium davidsonii TaxID=34287 RepID=A0A7J8T547_GOSDV|nr:hypothetical protein [Gossypium davidsonii]
MSCSGVVIRNETWIVFGSKLVIHDNILTTFAAEVMACLQAIQLGLDLQLSVVEIKRDAHSMSNGVAHILAIEGLKREESTNLVNRVPPYAAEEVVTDQKWVEVMDVVEGSLNISL